MNNESRFALVSISLGIGVGTYLLASAVMSRGISILVGLAALTLVFIGVACSQLSSHISQQGGE